MDREVIFSNFQGQRQFLWAATVNSLFTPQVEGVLVSYHDNRWLTSTQNREQLRSAGVSGIFCQGWGKGIIKVTFIFPIMTFRSFKNCTLTLDSVRVDVFLRILLQKMQLKWKLRSWKVGPSLPFTYYSFSWIAHLLSEPKV